jgi:uncharacterized repeat protein (TIGR02543 family)
MKKIKFLTSLVLIASMSFLTVACSDELAAPSGFSVNADNVLSWSSVDDASRYRIEVVNRDTGESILDTKTVRTSLSLDSLEEGDYIIRVQSIGSGYGDTVSSWSENVEFHKNYETGLIYTLINNNTEYQITKVGKAVGDIVIEDVYRGKPVTQIKNAAFRSSSKLTGITIGANVTSIGENAFYNCTKLTRVDIPDSVTTIGESAFSGCSSLTSVSLPKDLVDVPKDMFAYCRKLEEVNFGENILSIGESAFYQCSLLTELVLPEALQTIGDSSFQSDTSLTSVTFGSNLESIDKNAFYGCTSLTTLNFAEDSHLDSIGNYAFGNCDSLAEVNLPEGLTDLGNYVFYASDNLEKVTIPDSVSHVGAGLINETKLYNAQISGEGDNDGYIYADKWLTATTTDVKQLKSLTAANFKSDVYGIADYVFASAKYESVNLPASVKYIGKYSFAYEKSLTKFITPDGSNLLKIDSAAFAFCDVLSNVQLKKGLEVIENYAFYKCSMLDNNSFSTTSLVPSTVKRVGTRAFYQTALWTAVENGDGGVIYAGNWVVGAAGLDDESSKKSITLNSGVVGIADFAFYNCTSIQAGIGNLSSVQYIGRGAFYGCSNLTQVSLSSDVEEIKEYTFYKCSNLFSVTLPFYLTSIGNYAFYKCTTLKSFDLSTTKVNSIGTAAFLGCNNLENLDLGKKNLETIGNYAFYGCDSLTELAIPDTVKSIGNYAFAECSEIESVSLGSGVETIGNAAFKNCTLLHDISIPSNVKSIGDYAFYNCKNIRALTLSNGLESIGNYAFSGVKNIKSVTLPQSLVSIGKSAFKGCTGLQSIVISGNIKEIGAYAFYGCKSATIYAALSSSAENGWNGYWNSSYRPVVWGVTLSEDAEEEAYVSSITVGEISNSKVIGGMTAPTRDGYEFVGWSTNQNATVAEYTANDLANVPSGTTVYSVWAEKTVADETEDTNDENGESGESDPDVSLDELVDLINSAIEGK